ncbi:tetratricopeptide repeat protein [Aurantiacibacter aquimixticola]|uniref:Tetratricopeptide repeat protein n=1 Tax=Aurantiacibacter aquimixticola TaxID=1958945 RepID=A0A419RUE9_9SPHN|nr:tetratricopeptide repeat protein [Aurantiacibacter aquimixticola]RJY09374.1 hypothetical protein D6201_08415 [Aurantiacibacter aquimixticola]
MIIRNSILAAALAISLAGCGISAGDPLATGEAAFAERDYHAARVALANATNSENPDPRAAELYARTLLALGDGESAQRVIDQLQARAQPPADIAAMSAHAALLRGDFALALERADASPSDPLAEWVAIRALGELERLAEALKRADVAVETHATDARLLALRGAIALSRRALGDAKILSERALAADDENIDALMLAGQLRAMRGDHEGAREIYASARQHNPADLGALFALAAVEGDLGNAAAAREHLAEIEARAPGHPMALLLGARLAFLEGDLDEANALIQRAEGDIGKIPQGRLLMGEIAYLRGFPAQARAHLERFLAQQPGHMHASTVLARALAEEGEPRAAWDIAAPLADSATATPQILALASSLAARLDEEDRFSARLNRQRPEGFAQAVRDAQRAFADGDAELAERRYAALVDAGGGSDAVILNNAAHAALGAGDKSEALRRARLAHELAPRDPRVRDTLGWILLENGQREAALRHLSAAIDGQPGNLQIRWHYANALVANGRNGEARRIVAELRDFAGPEQREAMDRLLARI